MQRQRTAHRLTQQTQAAVGEYGRHCPHYEENEENRAERGNVAGSSKTEIPLYGCVVVERYPEGNLGRLPCRPRSADTALCGAGMSCVSASVFLYAVCQLSALSSPACFCVYNLILVDLEVVRK